MVVVPSEAATARKIRLFACAGCRDVLGDVPADNPLSAIVETGERYADRLASDDERQAAWETAQQILARAVAEQEFEKAAYIA